MATRATPTTKKKQGKYKPDRIQRPAYRHICLYCGYEAARASHLDLHIVEKHPGKPTTALAAKRDAPVPPVGPWKETEEYRAFWEAVSRPPQTEEEWQVWWNINHPAPAGMSRPR